MSGDRRPAELIVEVLEEADVLADEKLLGEAVVGVLETAVLFDLTVDDEREFRAFAIGVVREFELEVLADDVAGRGDALGVLVEDDLDEHRLIVHRTLDDHATWCCVDRAPSVLARHASVCRDSISSVGHGQLEIVGVDVEGEASNFDDGVIAVGVHVEIEVGDVPHDVLVVHLLSEKLEFLLRIVEEQRRVAVQSGHLLGVGAADQASEIHVDDLGEHGLDGLFRRSRSECCGCLGCEGYRLRVVRILAGGLGDAEQARGVPAAVAVDQHEGSRIFVLLNLLGLGLVSNSSPYCSRNSSPNGKASTSKLAVETPPVKYT